jgi:hypothetical protein
LGFGLLDELAIFNRPLTAEEIGALHQSRELRERPAEIFEKK